VSLARFFAAGCLEKTFPRDPWVLKTALSISLP
jgi:hypothetical protein